MKLAALLTLSAAFFSGVAIGAYAEWYYRANYLRPQTFRLLTVRGGRFHASVPRPPQVRRDQLRVVAV